MPTTSQWLASAGAFAQICQPTPVTKPDPSMTVSCVGDACDTLVLDASTSDGFRIGYQWYIRGQPVSTQERLFVDRDDLLDEPIQLRVRGPGGVSWLEIHDIGPGGIIDQPDPISPFVILEDGTCQVGSIAYDSAAGSAPVGGCITGVEMIGMRWLRTSSGTTTKGASLLHVTANAPYIYENVPPGTPVTASSFTYAPFSPGPTDRVFTTRQAGTSPLYDTGPPSAVSAWVPPAPLYDIITPPTAHFSTWTYLEPGDSLTGQWVHAEEPGATVVGLYLGLQPTPKTERFEIACPSDIKTRQSTLLDANLPVLTRLDIEEDLDGDGFAGSEDCDDFTPWIHPGAVDLPCDGVDADCSGDNDADGDGDGQITATCGGLDCDDTNPTTGAFFPELPNNQADDDCDGQVDEWCEDADIIVSVDTATIQAALDQAQVDDRICIEPGVYQGGILIPAKRLELFGAENPEDVILVGDGVHATVTFEADVGPATVLHDLSIKGGGNGGILIDGASPTLERIHVHSNHSTYGGGIQVLLQGGTTVHMSELHVMENTALDGGGIGVRGDGTVQLHDSRIVSNEANDSGGGIALSGGASLITMRTTLEDNAASRGGGIGSHTPSLTMLNETTLSHNQGAHQGGAIWQDMGTRSRLDRVTVVGNAAEVGGAMWMHDASDCDGTVGTTIANSVIAHNMSTTTPGAILSGDPASGGPSGQTACTTIFTSLMWGHTVDVEDPAVVGSWTSEPPAFASYHPALPSERRDLRFGPAASLQWGATTSQGGGHRDWYRDRDNDRLFDGWEALHGLDPTVDDAHDDLDGDGLTNGQEAWNGTWPELIDTDGGDVPDGEELTTGTDPLDPADG